MRKIRKMGSGVGVSVISALALCFAGTGCGGDSVQKVDAQSAQFLIEQDTGHKLQLIKTDTNVPGYSVFQDTVTGEIFAVNVSIYTPGMTIDQLRTAEGTNGIIHNLHEQDSTDMQPNPFYNSYDAASDPTYTIQPYEEVTTVNYVGSSYTFEEGTPYLKDLEKMGANMDAAANQQMGQFLSSQYGLSEDRSLEVARLVNNWSTLSKSRSMTAADLKEFSTQVLGSDLGSFQKAYEKSTNSGDNKDLDALIQKAASTNDISPEQARKVMKSFLN